MRTLFLLCALSFSFLACAAVGTPVRTEAVVPDETTAIAIAKAVLVPIYGEHFDRHRRRHPVSARHDFHATRYEDRWVVEDAPPSRLRWVEPILRVEIDRKRGTILRISEY